MDTQAPTGQDPLPTRRAPTPHREVHVPYGVRLAAAWTWRLLVVAVGVLALLWLFTLLKVLVIPVVLAVLLTALLSPVARRLAAVGVPSLLGAGLTIILTLVSVVGLFVLVGQQIAVGFSGLQEQVVDGVAQVQNWLTDGPLDLGEEQIDGFVQKARDQVSDNSDQLVSGALAATTTVGQVVSSFFIALFATLFFLGDGPRIWRWVVSLLPAGARGPADGAGRSAWVTLTAYIRATIAVALADAVGIGLGALILLGPSLALPIAVLVFLTAFVPIVGAILSGAVAVLVALVTEGFVAALILLAVVIVVQQLESNVLQPVLMGRAVALHPLGVALAVTAGILLAGIVGALFAVPLVAVLNTVARHLSSRDDMGPQQVVAPTEGGHDPPTDLLQGFTRACADAGSRAPAADVEAAGMDLLRRWSDPARGYHDRRHLGEVLERLEQIGGDAATAAPTRLAAWFHDAVYDGEPGAEERSADLARCELVALGVPDDVADRVAALVQVTATHELADGDAEAEALCDADLAVLAARPDRYDEYVAGVRREYTGIDDEAFAAGRTAVLGRLAGREALFRTEHGRRHWEQAARTNVAAELHALRQVEVDRAR